MHDDVQAYGLWSLVIINSLVFIIFAFSFSPPQSKRDWRSFSAFSAFIVALFTEMYGFPLTIYLFSGWLTTHLPGINIFSHDAGHLLEELVGWRGNPHFGPFHIASNILIFAGFIILAQAWRVLYDAQRRHRLATTGLYSRIRHPQYVGFVMIMFGFLLQWPTIITVLMFPILVLMYLKLSYIEERDSERVFGQAWRDYAAQTPRFFPHLRTAPDSEAPHGDPRVT